LDEPNPLFGYTFSKGIVEPNINLRKVVPNPQFGSTFPKGGKGGKGGFLKG